MGYTSILYINGVSESIKKEYSLGQKSNRVYAYVVNVLIKPKDRPVEPQYTNLSVNHAILVYVCGRKRKVVAIKMDRT